MKNLTFIFISFLCGFLQAEGDFPHHNITALGKVSSDEKGKKVNIFINCDGAEVLFYQKNNPRYQIEITKSNGELHASGSSKNTPIEDLIFGVIRGENKNPSLVIRDNILSAFEDGDEIVLHIKVFTYSHKFPAALIMTDVNVKF